MANLTRQDYEAVLELVGTIHACRDADDLPRRLVEELSELVGADRVAFEYHAPSVGNIWGVAEPHLEYTPELRQRFFNCLSQHPSLMYCFSTGDISAMKISDFLTRKQWHDRQLYHDLFRWIDCEDQFGMCLRPPGGPFEAVVLYQGRWKCSERDRAVLNLLRPHLAQAWETAQSLRLLREQVQRQEHIQDVLAQQALELKPDGKPPEIPQAVRDRLRRYFDVESARGGRFPNTLQSWIDQRIAAVGRKGQPDQPWGMVVRRRRGRRLFIRLLPPEPERERGPLLLLEERTDAAAVQAVASLGLTQREIDVLLQVERGQSNRDTAAELGLAPGTVKKHLDNIYAKLGVRSRSEAVSRLHELTG